MTDRHLIALALVLLPTLTLAAGVATPPAEMVEQMPETTLWLFGLTLAALLGCVGIIARLVNNGFNKTIQHSKEITQAHIAESARINEAQWQEIRKLTEARDHVDRRVTIIETDYSHCCGGRRATDMHPRRINEN